MVHAFTEQYLSFMQSSKNFHLSCFASRNTFDVKKKALNFCWCSGNFEFVLSENRKLDLGSSWSEKFFSSWIKQFLVDVFDVGHLFRKFSTNYWNRGKRTHLTMQNLTAEWYFKKYFAVCRIFFLKYDVLSSLTLNYCFFLICIRF